MGRPPQHWQTRNWHGRQRGFLSALHNSSQLFDGKRGTHPTMDERAPRYSSLARHLHPDILSIQHVACRHRVATDHDGVKLTLQLQVGKNKDNTETATWGPRRLKADGVVEQQLNQPAPRAQDPQLSIAKAAKAITRPGRTTVKYTESPALKQLRRTAHGIPPGDEAKQAWKQIKKTKEQERRRWLQQKASEAAQLSWGAYRSLQHHKQRKQGWQLPLMDPPDWEEQLRKHFRGIFNKVPAREVQEGMQHIRKTLEQLCKRTPWRPFDPGEVTMAVSRWARNKSCGPDGISHEAMTAILQHPQWEATG